VPRRDWSMRVRDILEAIDRIGLYVAGMSKEQFIADQRTIDAVVRNLIVLGEAAKHVPADVVARSSTIPWPDMAGMRDVVVHEYFGVSLDILWETVLTDLPPLAPLLRKLLDDHDMRQQEK